MSGSAVAARAQGLEPGQGRGRVLARIPAPGLRHRPALVLGQGPPGLGRKLDHMQGPMQAPGQGQDLDPGLARKQAQVPDRMRDLGPVQAQGLELDRKPAHLLGPTLAPGLGRVLEEIRVEVDASNSEVYGGNETDDILINRCIMNKSFS